MVFFGGGVVGFFYFGGAGGLVDAEGGVWVLYCGVGRGRAVEGLGVDVSLAELVTEMQIWIEIGKGVQTRCCDFR